MPGLRVLGNVVTGVVGIVGASVGTVAIRTISLFNLLIFSIGLDPSKPLPKVLKEVEHIIWEYFIKCIK